MEVLIPKVDTKQVGTPPGMIFKKNNQYITVISKSIMAAKKKKKKLLAEIFCIFECLLTQDPTNQATKLS